MIPTPTPEHNADRPVTARREDAVHAVFRIVRNSRTTLPNWLSAVMELQSVRAQRNFGPDWAGTQVRRRLLEEEPLSSQYRVIQRNLWAGRDADESERALSGRLGTGAFEVD
jgi:hypothetical protein